MVQVGIELLLLQQEEDSQLEEILLIEYILKACPEIDVGVIDFRDGYIPERLKGCNVKFINYMDKEWDIEPNSVVFCPTERLCLLKPLKENKFRDSIKIITIVWETKIGWGCLYPPSYLRRFANLLYKTDSIMFIDLGCKIATESKHQLNRTFKPKYLPLYFKLNADVEKTKSIVSNDEYNIAW